MIVRRLLLIIILQVIARCAFAQQQDFYVLFKNYMEAVDNENNDSALVVTIEMQKIAEKTFGWHSWQNIRSLNAIGYIYINMGNSDSALAPLQKAYSSAVESPNPQDTLIYKPVSNLAKCYALKNNKDSAAYYSDMSLLYYKKNWGENSNEYINEVSQIANNLWDLDRAKAYNYYNRTLFPIEKLFGKKSRAVTEQLLHLDDSIFNNNPKYYHDYLGSKKDRVYAIFYNTTPGDYTFQDCDSAFRAALNNNQYDNAWGWGLVALHNELRNKENTQQFAQAAQMLGILYQKYYAVQPFANYFYSISSLKGKSRAARIFTQYTNNLEKHAGDIHFVEENAINKDEMRLVVPIGHTIQVNTIEFSPDKKYIISTSYDKSAKIWEANTGKLILTLQHTTPVSLAKYSPDGHYIITLPHSSDSVSVVKLWDNKGNLLKSLITDSTSLNDAVFSPDGKSILVACGDDMARKYDIQSGRLQLLLPHSSGGYVRFSPDGRYILSLDGNGYAHIWNALTGMYIQQINDFADMKINAVEYSPSGRYFALSWGKRIRIFDAYTLDTVSAMYVPHENENGFVKVAFSPDEKEILVCSFSDSVKIYNVKTGVLVRVIPTNTRVSAGSYHPDGKYIIIGSEGLTMLNSQTGQVVRRFKGHTEMAENEDMSPDGNFLVIPDRGGIARVWETATAKLKFVLKGHNKWIWAARYSHDGNYIVTCSFDSTARIWDAHTGALVSTLKGHTEKLRSAAFHPGGAMVITAADDNRAILWDIKSGKMIDSVRFSYNKYNDYLANKNATVLFNNDGSLFITYTVIDSVAKIWDTQTRKLKAVLSGHSGNVYDLAISPDGQNILTVSTDSTARIWDIQSGMQIKAFKYKESLYNISYSPAGDKFAVNTENAKILINNTATGATLATLIGHSSTWGLHFSADGKKLLTDGVDNLVFVWDIATGKPFMRINANAGYMVTARFSKDENHIIGVCGDGSTKIWDAQTGALQYSFFVADTSDYFLQIPSGYYQSTQNASKLLHYVTSDLKTVTFDQLDIRYNRPDIVQQAIGNTDTVLVEAYKMAYEKRIRKLGIDTTQFKTGYSVPECDFKNRDMVEYEQSNHLLTLHISGRDSTYMLDRFNVWVNESPVFGIRGISLKAQNSNRIDTTITLTLSTGENRIETSVTNFNGTESYRMPLNVKYEPAIPPVERLHFIGIGINQFADKVHNLKWSVKDIRDLADSLKAKYGENCTINTLFDQNVSVEKVIALKKELLQTSVNDKVIIAYSGHGLLSKDYDYYLSTYNVNFKNPEQNGLPYDVLEGLLDSIPARKKLMLIDACHSGEVDKEEMQHYKTVKTSLKNAKGGMMINTDSSRVGMKNSFELMQSLFANVGRSTGATIISAAGGTQYALENSDLKNGVFTYSILEYMQTHPHVTVTALKEVVNKRVTELTKGMQVPTARSENDTVDWDVW